MDFKVKIPKILSIFTIFLLISSSPTLTSQQSENPNNMVDTIQFNKGLETFGKRLFSELANRNPGKNIVFSPFSIQTCIAMARMGAEGKTALAMDQALGLSAQNADELARKYHDILAMYENNSILKIANKIYVMQNCKVQDSFNELLTTQFFSSAEAVNFANNNAAAQTINSWVESKTNNLIKNLIAPQSLDANTRLVLVNAIHFKGEWEHAFSERSTRERDFYLDDIATVKVPMMHTKAKFRYGEFDDLDASGLEMPYKDSDLSMFIILPNTNTGLRKLEEKLENANLADLMQRMYSTEVIVDIPKFKAEFSAELSDPLQKLGLSQMFARDAEFGKMLNSTESFQVSKIVHKAFIEVNEKGTEAAAATGMGIRKKRALEDFTEIKEFNVEHPFVFKILQKDSSKTSTSAPSNVVLFEGKIKEIDKIVTTNLNEIKDEL